MSEPESEPEMPAELWGLWDFPNNEWEWSGTGDDRNNEYLTCPTKDDAINMGERRDSPAYPVLIGVNPSWRDRAFAAEKKLADLESHP